MSVIDSLPSKSSVAETFRQCHARARFPKMLMPWLGYRSWVEVAFKDFYSLEGAKSMARFRSKLTRAAYHIVRLYDRSRKNPGKKGDFARALLLGCQRIATPDLRHLSSKLSTFHDVTVEAEILRIFVETLADENLWPNTKPVEIALALVEHSPASRPALAVWGQFELARGQIEKALEAARRGLAVTSSCPSAQRLMRSAWTERLKQNPSALCTEIALEDLSDRFCSRPFTYISTTPNGHTWLCDCGGWLPYSAGDLFEAESAEAVWNSESAIEIRRSILDGDFSYCNRTLCPSLIQNLLPKKSEVDDPLLRQYIQNHTTRIPEAPKFVQLSHDHTCNLVCPSCRPRLMVADAAQQEKLSAGRDRVVLPLLRQVKGTVMITGWGDPFASKHYRSILAALNPEEFPGLQLEIVTNGLLLTPAEWNKFPRAHCMISRIKVSVDAATAEPYQQLRPPGRWPQLVANLEFLSSLRREGKLKEFWINFVVQKANFREMLDFIKLGQRLNVNAVFFQKLWNIGSLPPKTFAEMDVASPSHPLHPELLKILQDPLMKDPIVVASNLQLVFDEAGAKK